MVMQHMLKVMQHMLLGAQHMLRVMQHMCDSVRIKLSQPNLAEVGVGAELGKNTNKHFLDKGADSYHYPLGY